MSLTSHAGTAWGDRPYTAAVVLANGLIIQGDGIGATGEATGEVCFNTAITGYQEILTDPSYAGQIITFTFPHIGNVGANPEDSETTNLAAASGVRGCILHAPITSPSNYRAAQSLDRWLSARGVIGISGIDTRALTMLIRESGMPNAVIAHNPDGAFDFDALKAKARNCPSMEGAELARTVTAAQSYQWSERVWTWNRGFAEQDEPEFHVVAIDYGIKRNILRCLASAGCRVTVLPADATAQDVFSRKPDGVFLSNGPGDPAATGDYTLPVIQKVVHARNTPVWHLSRPSAPGARARRPNDKNASRASWSKSSRHGLCDREGRNYFHEPWFRSGTREPAPFCGGNARLFI